MSKKQKITDYIEPAPTPTNGNGENLHHHVFLAVDHNRSVEQEGYDTQIRDQIVDLVSSSWNATVTNDSLPKLTEFRCDTIHNCFRKLTFHELIVLYYTCSTRRCLVEVNMKALEDVFCYIYPQDLQGLIEEMDNFIEVNGLNFHRQMNENEFFEKYMKSFFQMMLDPVEEGDVDWLHPDLNEE